MENRGLYPSGPAARPLASVSPASPTPALAKQSAPPAVPWLRCYLPRKAAAPFAAARHLKKITIYFEGKKDKSNRIKPNLARHDAGKCSSLETDKQKEGGGNLVIQKAMGLFHIHRWLNSTTPIFCAVLPKHFIFYSFCHSTLSYCELCTKEGRISIKHLMFACLGWLILLLTIVGSSRNQVKSLP